MSPRKKKEEAGERVAQNDAAITPPIKATGPRNARTDPESGVRRYIWEAIEYPSNTSLRRLVGIPFTLHNWILSQHIEAALDVFATDRSREAKADLRKLIRQLGVAKRDRAADLGTRVHAAAAAGTVPDRAPADERPLIYQYQHWLANGDIEVVLAERQVFNLTLGYAGSFDILGREAWTRRIGIVDIKTGDGIYLDHVLQLLGYAFGEFIGADDIIDTRATDLLHEVAFVGVLHLSAKGWEYIELDVDARARRAFIGMTHLAHWLDRESLDDLIIRKRIGHVAVPPLLTEGTDGAHQPTDAG